MRKPEPDSGSGVVFAWTDRSRRGDVDAALGRLGPPPAWLCRGMGAEASSAWRVVLCERL